MSVLTLFQTRLWGAMRARWPLAMAMALLLVACGSDGPTDGAVPPAATATDALQSQGQALGRKAPTLASTVYGVGCSRDAECAVIPTGDVCRCAGWGAVASTDAVQFLQRRTRLGSRCSDGRAAECPVDPSTWAPRCRANQCVADKPHDFTCVDQALPSSPWPVHQRLEAQSHSHPDVLSACPFTMAPPEGSSQVWLLQPGVAGKYRIALTDTEGRADGPDHWFYLRTPDCRGDNVTCRWCAAGAERCFADEVLGPDDAVVVVVRNCDARCVLSVGRWDPDHPLEPPL